MIYRFSPTKTETIDGVINGYLPPFPGPIEEDTQHGNFHGRIDPNLSAGGDAPMQQYLRDPHAPMFNMQPPHQLPYRAVQPDTMSSLTPQSQGRHDSPFSQHQPSVASSAQSPRTESDMLYESTQGPSTPPDMKSPFTRVCEPWDGELLTGLSSLAPTDGCVNPSDIHPSQVHFDDFNEKGGSREFTLDQGLSFDGSSSTTHYHGVDVAQQAPLLRMSSPAIGFQHRSALDPVYPDPETIDEITNSVEEVTIDPKPCATETQEYRSIAVRNKPARAAKAPARRGRPRRSQSTLTGGSRVMKTATTSRSLASRRLPASTAVNACRQCALSFKDAVTLQKHIRTQHRRPFICVFHFAGCAESFANKNEWKRHVQAQHLNLHFWLCTHGACGSVMTQDCQVPGSPTHGRPFRRKDLFTQHVRRMHLASPSSGKSKRTKYAATARDDKLTKMQDDAFRKRCDMPKHMCCPAPDCGHEFHGQGTWNDRMEHVARHLEGAASDEEPLVQFGGPEDDTLTLWAASEDVKVIYKNESQDWQFCQPLKNAKVDLKAVPGRAMEVDEDAEGEECV